MKRIFMMLVVLSVIAGGIAFATPGDILSRGDYDYVELEVPATVLSVLADYGFDASLITDGVDVPANIQRELMRIEYLSGNAIASAANAELQEQVVFRANGPAYIKVGNSVWCLGLD